MRLRDEKVEEKKIADEYEIKKQVEDLYPIYRNKNRSLTNLFIRHFVSA